MLKEKNKDFYIMSIIRIGLILILFLPLLFIDSTYFPFVTTRNLVFRLIISIIFPLYLYLFFKDKKYWPKFNKGFIFIFLFIISLTISSLLGSNFSFSFWSNFERMDGLISWYFLFLYIFVLLGFLNYKKEINKLFNFSIFSAILVSLFSLLQQLDVFNNSNLFGLGGILGNSAYLGSYMFIHIVLVLYLFFKKSINKGNIGFIIYYIFTFILFLYTLIISQNRGSFLGFLLFIFLLGIFYLWFNRKNRKYFYYFILSFFILSFLFIGLLTNQKDNNWVKKVTIFSRLTNISLDDITTQSRLVIWRNSLLGLKEKPFLGWGEENFVYVFNKYFPEEIYHDSNSEIWFDRPHNIFILYLVQGGIVGFFLYLCIFFYLFYFLFKKYLLKKDENNNWFFSFFWISFLISFMFHNLFIFNNINTNIVFYLILAYLFSLKIGRAHV